VRASSCVRAPRAGPRQVAAIARSPRATAWPSASRRRRPETIATRAEDHFTHAICWSDRCSRWLRSAREERVTPALAVVRRPRETAPTYGVSCRRKRPASRRPDASADIVERFSRRPRSTASSTTITSDASQAVSVRAKSVSGTSATNVAASTKPPPIANRAARIMHVRLSPSHPPRPRNGTYPSRVPRGCTATMAAHDHGAFTSCNEDPNHPPVATGRRGGLAGSPRRHGVGIRPVRRIGDVLGRAGVSAGAVVDECLGFIWEGLRDGQSREELGLGGEGPERRIDRDVALRPGDDLDGVASADAALVDDPQISPGRRASMKRLSQPGAPSHP
jgi:hypothetical protein